MFKNVCDQMDVPINVWKITNDDATITYSNSKSNIKIGNRYSNIYPDELIPKNNIDIINLNSKRSIKFLDKKSFMETITPIDNSIFILEAINKKIREPLTNISGISQICNNVSQKELRNYLKLLKISISDMYQVAINLTYLINLLKNNIVTKKENINLDNFFDSCIKLSSANIKKNNKNINIDNALSNITIKNDIELLEYIVMSILEFMIDNMTNGKIKIFFVEDNDHITIKIKDNGNGLDDYQIASVNSILNNENINIKSYKCFGLGLYISNIMASLINVKITFDSKKYIGTIFTLLIKIEKK